ncbi:MAG TPA: DUF4012 domain-containing protein [Actinomycetota bacterium]|nr:DUF4012 domain-containing protein [Actinomycetota bacterium]
MRTKLFLAAVVFLLAVVGLSAYLAVAVGSELYEARSVLAGPAGDLDRDALLRARRHLVRADEILDGVAANVVSMVPVAGHSVRAVEDVTETMLPVLDAADALTRKLDAIEGLQVVENGAIRTDLLGALRGPLVRQVDALERLVTAARERRSGWIPPPLWDALDDLERRASGYRDGARRGAEAVRLMGPMLGQAGPRKYLVVMLNNAELRGAGGIPSAAGVVKAVEGRLRLGRFRHTVDLRGPRRPYPKVAAPADFRRRFGFYKADTTFWTNITFSPDVPDVALVAARAFKKVTGKKVDGAILVDPRGIAALMPEDAAISIAGTGVSVGRADLPGYTYSGVYEDLGGATERRRTALLELGQGAFEAILAGGLAGRATLEDAGRAVAGGHVRIVSFDPAEQQVLDALAASGDLDGAPGDSLLVAAQNFSADKLDYWVRRGVTHSCSVDEGAAACTTTVTLSNRAPEGLTRYVAGKPYGALEELVEVYVPEAATVRAVELDGTGAEVEPDRQDGHEVAGAFLEPLPGERSTMTVRYDLPLEGDGYTLEVLPQPLTHDARLRIALDVPRGWSLEGEGEREPGRLRFSGPLDRTLRFEARPADRSGLSALWEGLVGFWRDPVF